MLVTSPSQAQFFDTGQDPSGIKWQQIRTENFVVVYDRQMQSEAIRFAQLLESYRLPASASLNANPRPIRVVIHNHSVTSNGMVPIAPWRMEAYPLSPQNTYAQEWMRQLAIHEYRHVAQYDIMDQGFTKVLSWIFGEQATAAVMGVYLPFWYIEGDATVIETGLSRSGRGRLPEFIAPLRTQMLELGPYSYDKASFGSFRDHVPNRYEYGYHLVGMTRKYYGPGVWQHSLTNVARKPYMIVPFFAGLNDSLGMGKAKLHRAMSDSLVLGWETSREGQSITSFSAVPVKSRKVYTDYRYPFSLADKSIVVLRSGLGLINQFVRIDSSGKERVIHTPGRIFDEGISCNGKTIVWSEYDPHIRWENKSFGIIWKLDIETGKARKLTERTRYFAPAISNSGNWIAASYTDETNHHELHILDAQTGEVIYRRTHPEGKQMITPSWSNDDRFVVMVTMGDDGKAIEVLEVLPGSFERVLPPGPYEFRQPMLRNDTVFYTDGSGGVRNLYGVHRYVKMIYMLTSSKYGMTDPYLMADGQGLMYSDYTAAGFRPVMTRLDQLKVAGVPRHNDFSLDLADLMAEQEGLDEVNEADTFRYEISKYNLFLNMFRPHSWGPLSISAASQTVDPGFAISSQDFHATTFVQAGWAWDLDRQKGTWYAQIDYKRFFPVFDLRWSTTEREGKGFYHNGDEFSFFWTESNYRAGMMLPLNFDKGAWYTRVQPSASFSRINLTPFEGTPDWIEIGNVNSLNYGLFLLNQRRTSIRDVRPRWRQSLSLNYRHSPGGEHSLGTVASAWGSFYFPGIGKHHSIRLDAAVQRKESGNGLYNYSNLIPVPRGVHSVRDDSLFYTSFSYSLPLLYPDIALGPIAYIKRVKADIYLDRMLGFLDGKQNSYQSLGLDLTVDGHFLRFLSPVEIGLRTNYLTASGDFVFGLILNVDFDGF